MPEEPLGKKERKRLHRWLPEGYLGVLEESGFELTNHMTMKGTRQAVFECAGQEIDAVLFEGDGLGEEGKARVVFERNAWGGRGGEGGGVSVYVAGLPEETDAYYMPGEQKDPDPEELAEGLEAAQRAAAGDPRVLGRSRGSLGEERRPEGSGASKESSPKEQSSSSSTQPPGGAEATSKKAIKALRAHARALRLLAGATDVFRARHALVSSAGAESLDAGDRPGVATLARDIAMLTEWDAGAPKRPEDLEERSHLRFSREAKGYRHLPEDLFSLLSLPERSEQALRETADEYGLRASGFVVEYGGELLGEVAAGNFAKVARRAASEMPGPEDTPGVPAAERKLPERFAEDLGHARALLNAGYFAAKHRGTSPRDVLPGTGGRAVESLSLKAEGLMKSFTEAALRAETRFRAAHISRALSREGGKKNLPEGKDLPAGTPLAQPLFIGSPEEAWAVPERPREKEARKIFDHLTGHIENSKALVGDLMERGRWVADFAFGRPSSSKEAGPPEPKARPRPERILSEMSRREKADVYRQVVEAPLAGEPSAQAGGNGPKRREKRRKLVERAALRDAVARRGASRSEFLLAASGHPRARSEQQRGDPASDPKAKDPRRRIEDVIQTTRRAYRKENENEAELSM